MTRQPQEPATEGTNNMLGHVLPDCKEQGRGWMCKQKRAFHHYPHSHFSAKVHHFKLAVRSLIPHPMWGGTWVMALSGVTPGGPWSYKGRRRFSTWWGGWVAGHLKSTTVTSGYKAATAMMWLPESNISLNKFLRILHRSWRINASYTATQGRC